MARYAIAWDYDVDNPNPHALTLESVSHPTYEIAELTAASEVANIDEPDAQSYVIIEIPERRNHVDHH